MNEKIAYEIPKIEFIALNVVDIITTSQNEHDWNDDNVQEDGWL